jgi:hypothetical protein
MGLTGAADRLAVLLPQLVDPDAGRVDHAAGAHLEVAAGLASRQRTPTTLPPSCSRPVTAQ